MVRLPFINHFFLLVLTGLYIYPGAKLKSVNWQGVCLYTDQQYFPTNVGLGLPLYILPLGVDH